MYHKLIFRAVCTILPMQQTGYPSQQYGLFPALFAEGQEGDHCGRAYALGDHLPHTVRRRRL